MATKILQIVSIIFVNVGPSLANNIPRSNDVFTRYLSDKVEDTLFLKPVTEEEIIKLVNNTKSKTSKDHDDIDMCLVKKITPHLVTPLEHIFNTSLQKGVFLDGMKLARVIPLFKNGDMNDFTNYRPTSLLSQFSKILEKIFHNGMMSFIDDKQILCKANMGLGKICPHHWQYWSLLKKLRLLLMIISLLWVSSLI